MTLSLISKTSTAKYTSVRTTIISEFPVFQLLDGTQDLSIFIQALLKGVFFEKAETLSTMLTGIATDAPWRTYGLGIGRYTLPNGSYAYGHTGSSAGYASFVFHFPEENITASSVISADQGGAFMGFLLPSLGVIAEHLQDQK